MGLEISSSAPCVKGLGVSRRNFLRASIGGVTTLSSTMLPEAIFGQEAPPQGAEIELLPISGKKQYPLLVLWLQGGASNFDTFDARDPFASKNVRGPFNSIQTTMPGVRVSELMPNMAARMDQVALIRSIHHDKDDHGDAIRLCLSGTHERREGDSRDGLFARSKVTPALIRLSEYMSREGIGFTVFNANNHREPYGGIQEEDGLYIKCEFDYGNRYRSPFHEINNTKRFESRKDLLRSLRMVMPEQESLMSFEQPKRHVELTERAFQIIDGDMGRAFEVSNDCIDLRDQYGNNPLGRAALISKRLINAGAPLVLINDGFWDSHGGLKKDLKTLVPRLDKSLSALIDDLKDKAVIVVSTEFGRTPDVENNGRDHWTHSSFMLLAGPGIEPKVIGEVGNDGYIKGNSTEYQGSLMGEAILNAAGYARYYSRGGILFGRVPTYSMFS